MYAAYGSPDPDSSFARFVGAGIFSYWSASSCEREIGKDGDWWLVSRLFLCSWGELDRWMRCRWEELARHDAFKAGLEDAGAKGGGGQQGGEGGSEAAEERCY